MSTDRDTSHIDQIRASLDRVLRRVVGACFPPDVPSNASPEQLEERASLVLRTHLFHTRTAHLMDESPIHAGWRCETLRDLIVAAARPPFPVQEDIVAARFAELAHGRALATATDLAEARILVRQCLKRARSGISDGLDPSLRPTGVSSMPDHEPAVWTSADHPELAQRVEEHAACHRWGLWLVRPPTGDPYLVALDIDRAGVVIARRPGETPWSQLLQSPDLLLAPCDSQGRVIHRASVHRSSAAIGDEQTDPSVTQPTE